MQFNKKFSSTLAALTLVTTSVLLWDLPLAAWIAKYLTANAPSVKNSNLPDLLLITVVILTSLSWMVYFYLDRRKIFNQHKLFCRVTGTVLPLSFCTKIVLKWFFGRTETRSWLSDPSSYGFHWFAGTEAFQGFPSGHMLVLTPLFLALWNFYPRFRLYYGVAWFCLGIALIMTEYHFLGDVLAGVYIGTTVYWIVSSRRSGQQF